VERKAKMPRPSKPILPFRMTEGQYRHAEDSYEGRCRSCGHVQGPVEEDAEEDPCEACGARQVCGVGTLLEREEIQIIERGH